MNAHVGQTSADERAPRRRRMRAALAVTSTFLLVEIVGGVLSGSLALLADAAHMFTDVAALIFSYAAMSLAERHPTERHTFGFNRAEILAAFVNAQILLLISAYIFYEAYQRWQKPPEIATGLMLAVAVAGLVANLVCMLLLRGHHHESLNVKAAYLEVVTDALGSIGVIVAAVVIMSTGWYWFDPLISAGIGFLILPRTISLLRQSAHILLEGTPQEVNVAELRRRILAVSGVDAIHHLHVWTLTSGLHSASVHVRAAGDSPRGQVLRDVQQLFRDTPGMDHATIQVEWRSDTRCGVTECGL